mmetsp:Transcript_5463/g.8489  ORF Transcript_5463/g.8489 Transcript_5463/m.8489 type:complete len:140 (+) Transcript_5463:96-515(+)
MKKGGKSVSEEFEPGETYMVTDDKSLSVSADALAEIDAFERRLRGENDLSSKSMQNASAARRNSGSKSVGITEQPRNNSKFPLETAPKARPTSLKPHKTTAKFSGEDLDYTEERDGDSEKKSAMAEIDKFERDNIRLNP